MTGILEEKAKTRWCPFARQLVTIQKTDLATGASQPLSATSANRFENAQGSMCIASDCMAWRWVDASERGYCGLAGAPLA